MLAAVLVALLASLRPQGPEPVQVLRHDVEAGHALGSALAVDGDWLVAGAGRAYENRALRPRDGDRLVGVAYQRREGRWELHGELVAQRWQRHRVEAVAVRGTTAVLGIPGSPKRPSCALVFERRGEGWEHVQTLAPLPIEIEGWSADELPSARSFGQSVALGEDLLVVGAPEYPGLEGSVHVFEREAGTWRPDEAFHHHEPLVCGMGTAVAVAGRDVLVGVPGHWDVCCESGAVRVYAEGESGWSQVQVLRVHPSYFETLGNAVRDHFGDSLAVSGDRLLVGSPGPFTREGRVGSVHVYRRTGEGWLLEDEFTGAALDYRSVVAVALDGDRAAIASWTGLDTWAVRAFERRGTWVRVGIWSNLPDTVLAYPLALAGTDVLIGVPAHPPADPPEGSPTGAILVHEVAER